LKFDALGNLNQSRGFSNQFSVAPGTNSINKIEYWKDLNYPKLFSSVLVALFWSNTITIIAMEEMNHQTISYNIFLRFITLAPDSKIMHDDSYALRAMK